MTMIRPIEFSAIVQRTNDISSMKQTQDQKPVLDQNNITQTVQKNVQHTRQNVVKKDNADYNHQKFDAKEKGKNEYFRQKGERKEQKNETKTNSSVITRSRGFDFKV